MKKLTILLAVFFFMTMGASYLAAGDLYKEWHKDISADRLKHLQKTYPEIKWEGQPAGSIQGTVNVYKFLNKKTTRTGKSLVKILKAKRKAKSPFQWSIWVPWMPGNPVGTASVWMESSLVPGTDDWPIFNVNLETGKITGKNADARSYLDM